MTSLSFSAPNIITKAVLTLFFTLSLTACKSVSQTQIDPLTENTLVSKVAQRYAVEKMKTWEISGKLSVISPQDRSSVFINWQQSRTRSGNRFADSSQIKMTNLLGISLANLHYDGTIATMQTDGQRYIDRTPEGLIKQLTGWELPVSDLRYWIKALATTKDQATYDQHNLVSRIEPTCKRCEAWQITFAKYKRVNGIWLPHYVRLNNPSKETRITFNISQWTPK